MTLTRRGSHTLVVSRQTHVLRIVSGSNGSCQLSGRRTDAACCGEGLMMCLDETFYYFKGSSAVT